MPAAQKIYLVEDEALIVMELADRLARLGYEICGQAARGEQALEQIPLIGPDLVLMDIRLAGALTGLETAARLRPLLAVPVVFLSAFADSEMIDAAVCAGAFGYLTKPFEERELHATLQAALYRHKLERLQHEEKHRLEAMVRERTAELEAERRRLACIIEGTDSGTWEWNVQTGETVFNERWAEIIGYRLEELAPVSIQTWLTLAHPEDLARSNDILQRHFAGGLSHYDCECRMRHKDGRWIWVHDRGRVITRTEDGRPLMMYGSHMDVSARKEAETTYLRRTAELKEAQRIGQIGNWHLELATNQVVWSEELYRQYAADPTIPPPPYTEHRKFFTPESWERLSTALTHTCDTGIPYTLELQTVRTDGSNGWMWVRGEREVDADGNVVGIAGVAQDISARKAAEEALRLSEESLAITLSSIGDGVLATDLHGRVVRLNPEAERLTGWTQTEAAGHPVCDIFNIINEYTRQPQVIPVDEVLRTGRRVDLANHTILIARDGAERPIADSAAPIRDEAGTIRGVVLVFRDQTAELAAQRALRERERLLSSINQNLPGCFVYRVGFSPEGRMSCSYVSPNVLGITGLAPAEVMAEGEKLLSLVLPEDLSMLRSRIGQAILADCQMDVEVRLTHAAGGDLRWLRLRGSNVERRPDGVTVREGIAIDITESKAAEAEIRKLALVAARTDNGVTLTDATGRIEWINEAFTRLTGYTLDEMRGRTPGSMLQGPETDPAVVAMIREKLRKEQGFHAELVNYDNARRKYWVEIEVQPLRDERGQVTHYMGIEKNVTERKAAEAEVRWLNATLEAQVRQRTERLAQSEERFRRLAENMRDLLCVVDRENRFDYVSPSFRATLGYLPEDLLGQPVADYIHPVDRSAILEALGAALPGHGVGQLREFRFRHAQGRYMWLEGIGNPISDATGRLVGHVVTGRDVTERKLASETVEVVLRNTADVVGAEYYSALAFELGRALDVAIVCVAEALPGESLRLRPLAHFSDGKLEPAGEYQVPPGHPCETVLQTGEPLFIANGLTAQFPIGVCGRTDLTSYYGLPLRSSRRAPHGVLLIADTRPLALPPLIKSLLHIFAARAEAEITRIAAERESSQLQDRMFQSQKYEALGTLAGGIAHDFNNILTGILNFTALAQEDCPPNHPQIGEYLQHVFQSGNRAKDLVRQILLFSRAEQGQREPVLLQVVVKEALSLLRSTLPAAVAIDARLDKQAPAVLANPTQIHQLVMNLGINASQAMTDQIGLITVRLESRHVLANARGALAELKPGPHLVLEVTDTGCGMDEAVQDRIFEPFFTTKPVGEGTGLGLAVVRGIVKSHGGVIVVRSKPGAGTTFEIYFPVHESVNPSTGPVVANYPRGNGEHILLVDDEPIVVKSGKLMLERLGYRASGFTNADEALARFFLSPDDFQAIIADFQMPRMSGLTLAERVQAQRPAVPILIVSGYTASVTPDLLRQKGIAGILMKPYRLAELAESLTAVLRSRT